MYEQQTGVHVLKDKKPETFDTAYEIEIGWWPTETVRQL
jgi:hypothetical protein